MNQNITANTAELSKIRSEIGALGKAAASQGTEISFMRRDLQKVQEAVQGAGITIPAVGAVEGGFVINTANRATAAKDFGTDDNSAVFIQIIPRMGQK